MKLIKAPRRNPGDGKAVEHEILIKEIKFHKYKFNNRPIPTDKNRILIITCFSEFGCESIALMYCIPKIIQEYPGSYIICAGWYGREYLYRHLVDEYWEIEEKYQYLREFTNAFNHSSKNLHKLEKYFEYFGKVYKSSYMGKFCLGNTCRNCKTFWGESGKNLICPKCSSQDLEKGLLNDVDYYKKFAVQVPRPSIKTTNLAKTYLKPNSVGIFARGRVCYGRNLTPEFYIKLINQLESKGFNPIWLGEKQSVLPCPTKHIIDFSRLEESRNLELTLAIISQLCFTVQFWTASTRFASMMGVPWLLIETPDQIQGNGQEGIRIALTTDPNKKKIILSHYWDTMQNEDKALNLVDQGITEMYENNWDTIIGLVDNPDFIRSKMVEK